MRWALLLLLAPIGCGRSADESGQDMGGGSGGHAGGAGGHGGSLGPEEALAARLGTGVWRFEGDDAEQDGAWMRFTPDGKSGTLETLPVAGPTFTCAGAGTFEVRDEMGVSLTLPAPCSSTFFDVMGDLIELPEGALDGISVLVSQVTPMRGFRFPSDACDATLTECEP
jgi:hypothetical protein